MPIWIFFALFSYSLMANWVLEFYAANRPANAVGYECEDERIGGPEMPWLEVLQTARNRLHTKTIFKYWESQENREYKQFADTISSVSVLYTTDFAYHRFVCVFGPDVTGANCESLDGPPADL